MQSLLFSNEAICGMLVECYRGRFGNETGGVLVGPKSNKRIVTDIIPSTSFAERRPASYYQNKRDVRILNNKLRDYQSEGYDFKGYFHKHPNGIKCLSMVDVQACAEILESDNYKIDNFLIMNIITETLNNSFPIFTYIVSVDQTNQVVIQKSSTKVLPVKCILECIDCFETSEEGSKDEDINNRPSGERIEEEGESRPVRTSGGGNDNHQLVEQKKEPEENRCICQTEEPDNQDITG